MQAKRDQAKPKEPSSLGVVGRSIKQTGVDRRTQLESWGKEGDTPVFEIDKGCENVPEYYGTLEIL